MLINLEVPDATGEYARLVEGEHLQPVLALRDEAFGQRHFIVRDPAGNLVDVIENIPPSAEFIATNNSLHPLPMEALNAFRIKALPR
jgi:hypothetical protein